MRFLIILISLTVVVNTQAQCPPIFAENLIPNGNFEEGWLLYNEDSSWHNGGFYSDINFAGTKDEFACRYGVGGDFAVTKRVKQPCQDMSWERDLSAFGFDYVRNHLFEDHTIGLDGSGYVLAIDLHGEDESKKYGGEYPVLWEKQIELDTFSVYNFEAFIAQWADRDPLVECEVGVYLTEVFSSGILGEKILYDNIKVLGSEPLIYKELSFEWANLNSVDSLIVTIQITSLSDVNGNGNDFLIDDISFRGTGTTFLTSLPNTELNLCREGNGSTALLLTNIEGLDYSYQWFDNSNARTIVDSIRNKLVISEIGEYSFCAYDSNTDLAVERTFIVKRESFSPVDTLFSNCHGEMTLSFNNDSIYSWSLEKTFDSLNIGEGKNIPYVLERDSMKIFYQSEYSFCTDSIFAIITDCICTVTSSEDGNGEGTFASCLEGDFNVINFSPDLDGDTIYFRALQVEKPVTINGRSSITLDGSGQYQINPWSSSMILILASDVTVNDLIIQNATGYNFWDGDGILLGDNLKNLTFNNVTVKNSKSYGITNTTWARETDTSKGISNITINNCVFSENGNSGIGLSYADNVIISNTICSNNGEHGIHFEGTNFVYGVQYLSSDTQNGKGVINSLIEKTVCENNGNEELGSGVFIEGNSKNNLITGNVFSDNQINGITVNTISNTISKNSIYCNGEKGILLSGVSSDLENITTLFPEVITIDENNNSLSSINLTGLTNMSTGSVVEVFEINRDCLDCQGKIFIGDTVVKDGLFTYNFDYIVTDPENYVITITDNNTTSPFSSCVNNNVISSLQLIDEYRISLFPNPSKNVFTIQAEELIKNIVIIDLTGNVIFVNSTSSKNVTVNTNLQQGIYLLKVTAASGNTITEKIVIE